MNIYVIFDADRRTVQKMSNCTRKADSSGKRKVGKKATFKAY